MKILIAMQKPQRSLSLWQSIDDILAGKTPCSGNDGSIVRLAGILAESGFDVVLSTDHSIPSSQFPCISNNDVKPEEFDYFILHQSHWDGLNITFGNKYLHKTFLWLHRQECLAFVYTFLQAGGNRVICPSIDCANFYRALPQWQKQIVAIYNTYCSVFVPTEEPLEKRLLFIGSVTPDKGFVEVMEIWSYLAQKQANLKLAVAGSIRLHKGGIKTGEMGIATPEFESKKIKPWLETLPSVYQPEFLGALPPEKLRDEINKSWAIIVNPSWYAGETFCISAVDAQACNRTVFSIKAGGLKETVYQGEFQSLTSEKEPSELANLILKGLANPENVIENGKRAGEFVRKTFSNQGILQDWMALFSGQQPKIRLPLTWETRKDLIRDVMRLSGTGVLINSYRSPHDRKMLIAAKQAKK